MRQVAFVYQAVNISVLYCLSERLKLVNLAYEENGLGGFLADDIDKRAVEHYLCLLSPAEP